MVGGGLARQGASAAAGLMMFVPNLVVFIILQKSMMSTLVNSGIK
jgi:multiple sugar transport system permease protein